MPGNARLRHAVEIRHPSFLCDTFIDLLRKHKVALVVADSAGKWPYVEEVTAEFVYLRLHGDVELYSSGYTARALRRWRLRIRPGLRAASLRMLSVWCAALRQNAPPVTSTATSTTTRKSTPLRCPPPAGQARP